MSRLRRAYGASPLHLIVLLATTAVAAAAFVRFFDRSFDAGAVLVWFFAAIVVHDFVLLPFYSLLDRVVSPRVRPRAARNYVRVPAGLSLLLLLVFFPRITGLGEDTYHRASGFTSDGYLERWLIATAVMFALSAVAYVGVHRFVIAVRLPWRHVRSSPVRPRARARGDRKPD